MLLFHFIFGDFIHMYRFNEIETIVVMSQQQSKCLLCTHVFM